MYILVGFVNHKTKENVSEFVSEGEKNLSEAAEMQHTNNKEFLIFRW